MVSRSRATACKGSPAAALKQLVFDDQLRSCRDRRVNRDERQVRYSSDVVAEGRTAIAKSIV
jgi:hypothetical protein